MGVWKPFARQEEFLSLPDSIFEGFYGGAAGGGKSEVLLLLPIARGFFEFPDFKALLLRRTFPELEKSLILRSHKYYAPYGGIYKSTLKRWVFPSNAILDFGYAELEKDVKQYDTAEYNYIGFDELTHFTEFQYTYMMSRCRSGTMGLPSIVRSASNPGNIGHGWVRDRFVVDAPQGGVILKDSVLGTKRIFIPAKVTDNTVLMATDPDYVTRLNLLPEADRRAKRDGDWWTFAGQVFNEWRIEPFVGEPPNARHIVTPFEIPEWWPRILAVDWGFSAMVWAGWGAISPDKRLYLYREYTTVKTQISTWASNIAKLSRGEKLSAVVLDPSAWKKEGQDKTIADLFKEFSGLAPSKADNDRIAGKLLFHEYLRWKPKPDVSVIQGTFSQERANDLLRWQGFAAYKEYVESYQPKPAEILPKLQVFEGECPEFIKCIPLCVYAKDNQTSGKKSEDIAEFNGDDPYDGGRYLLHAAEHFINRKHDDLELQEQIAAANIKLNETQDMTSFYRRMESLEAQIKNVHRPIRRFRHR